jgi:transposase InsO family protein
MVTFALAVAAYIRSFFVTRHKLALEATALRQQLAVFKRKQTRPRLHRFDRLFWIVLRRLWPGWPEALIIVKPETVVSWHRAGFRLFWRCRSGLRPPGRPKVSKEIRQLIRRMKTENPSWGAPRIHGELLHLGFDISEPTVSRYLQRLKRRHSEAKAKRWSAFLDNHREVIAAFDFFTVPTITFRVLYCFFVIQHDRRRILHLNATAHPTSDWIVQQLREALPLPCRYHYVLFDHDAKFGTDVFAFLQASGIKPIRTSIRSPWQNGVAERWVGSCRREMLDHLIPLNEQHLRRLGREYLAYYDEDRTHIGLKKETPAQRPVESSPGQTREPLSLPRIGGLHHRYTWSEAA